MDEVRLTSALLWRATGIALLIDVPLLAIVARWVSDDLFRELKWHLAAAAFVVYAALWGVVASFVYWDAVYSAIFPAWSRWMLPPWFGLLFGAAALLFWRIGMAAPRWRVVWFVVLGGLVSLVGHSIGIARGLMRVPMLRDASAASALAFGVFEFAFYFSLIVLLAAVARRVMRRAA